ncbi:MAG TPA: DUF3313 family protein [Steroidobacteraceae bacterium]|nr:DUF3313 family protein [Steroidobacteraceae bacterium]
MMNGRLIGSLFLLVVSSVASAASAPKTWEGLEQTKIKGIDLAYVRPGVDFRTYTEVSIDQPVPVAFDKNWDPNRDVRSPSARLSAQEIQKIRDEMSAEFRKVFVESLTKGGYRVVDTVGESTLRITASLVNVFINAPDRMEPGRVRTYTMESGRMTLEMELRDGATGQLLSRIVDKRIAGSSMTWQRTSSVTNSADFRREVRAWADRLVAELDKVNGRAK